MKMKPIHIIAVALLLFAAGSIYYIQVLEPQTTVSKSDEKVKRTNSVQSIEAGGVRAGDSKFKVRTRIPESLITNLEEAERLILQTGIDPTDRNHQTDARMRKLVKRIDPSLYGELLARIDASLAESNYFNLINEPMPAIVGSFKEPISQSDMLKHYSREFLVLEWATHNMDDALAYASSAPDPGQDRKKYAIAAISTLVADEPLVAMTKVEQLPNAKFVEDVRQEVYRAWLIENPKSAFSWASEWPDEGQRKRYLIMGGSVIAKTDPGLALQVASAIKSADDRNEALSGIASAWSLSDPESFAMHLQNNTQYNTLENKAMVGSLVFNWYYRDKPSTIGWITGLPEGTTRDTAIHFLTNTMKVEWPPRQPSE